MDTSIRAFRSLMRQTVTIAPWSSQNAYGEPAFGTAVTYPARVVARTRMVRDTQGREVVSTATVYLGAAPTLSVKDRLTLPNGETPVIAAIGDYPDERGPHHSVVYLL